MIELNHTYFYLTPIQELPPLCTGKHKRYLCKCICGNEVIIDGGNLGRCTKSCGCKRFGNPKTHGYASHKKVDRLYHIWNNIKFRCENPKCKDYKNYGARGIYMCDEWRNDFMAFRIWALENGYEEHLTIDREDVNGIYEPNNCRWITRAENNKNKRNSRRNKNELIPNR